ncbi:hypothetical protein [Sphingomonas yabuuchiae]|uniref:hypothetical protein n=1 Tax=Sphingomonas yabuuchiae TaxID=172044 RepID=UPI003D96A5CA
MSDDLRKNMDIVSQSLFGDGFAKKNDGIGEAPDRGFEPDPSADPADVAKAWAEVAKRLTPGDWAAISAAAGVSPDILLPRK